MAEAPQSFVAGLSIPQRNDDAANLLQLARADGYDFVTTSLPHFPSTPSSNNNPRRDVTSLESKWWTTSVVGSVCDPSDFSALDVDSGGSGNDAMVVDDSKENHGNNLISALCSGGGVAKTAETYLSTMLEWASHMSIPAVILPPVPSSPSKAVHYARVLNVLSLQCSSTNVQLWVRTSLNKESLESFELLHRRCDGSSNLGCILCFDSSTGGGANAVNSTAAGAPPPPPPGSTNVGQFISLVHQFIGSNLRAVGFSTSVFLTNKRGYPTLSKSHQVLFTELLRRLGRTLRVLVEGMPLHHPPGPPPTTSSGSSAAVANDATGQTGCLAYLQYLRHLRTRSEVSDVLDTDESSMETSYLDHLQSPLQPLGDNLEFQTYETFERDPVKYARYGVAVQLAIRDGLTLGKLLKETVDDNKELYLVNILVVGAGRGPLIRAALEAVENVNRTLAASGNSIVVPKIVAVEKNSSAVLYLSSLLTREPGWREAVTVVECDMRYALEHPLLRQMASLEEKRADLLISELLGSFGDNELSPECLDGVQRCALMKETCISIPQRYTSYLAPVSSMRLHAEAQAQAYSPANPIDGPSGKPCGTLQAMETPYVVRSHAASQTHRELPCWEFFHPKMAPKKENKSNGSDSACGSADAARMVNNNRFVRLVFPPDPTHGAGYGPGYGPFNSAVSAMAQAAAVTAASSSSPSSSSVSSTIHGFLGTFHALLYQSPLSEKDVSYISITPRNFSVGMFSWFPLYFPLRTPIHVPEGASIGCSMWRRTDDNGVGGGNHGGKVWYEWCAEVITGDGDSPGDVLSSSPVHNPSGRSYHVRL